MEFGLVSFGIQNLMEYLLAADEEATFTSLMTSLKTISDTPPEKNIIDAILKAGRNKQDGSYVCELQLNDYRFTFRENSSMRVLSTNTYPSKEVRLSNVRMAELKKYALQHYLRAERELGNGHIDLAGVDLSGVDVSDIDVSGLSFEGVKVDRLVFQALVKKNADLTGINASNLNLSDLSCININLTRANLTNTTFQNSNLKCANLSGTKVDGANFTDALITLTNFTGSNVTDEQLQSAKKHDIFVAEQGVDQLPEMMCGWNFNIRNTYGTKRAPASRESGWTDSIPIDELTPHIRIAYNVEFPGAAGRRNLELKFLGKGEQINTGKTHIDVIACRHSSAHVGKHFLFHSEEETDYRIYSHEVLLAEHITRDIERSHIDLRTGASEVHLIDNNDFGLLLSEQFAEMTRSNEPRRAMFIETPHSVDSGMWHVMAVCLSYTKDCDENPYSIQFIDSLLGEATPIYSMTDDLNKFKTQKMGDYVMGSHSHEDVQRRYANYYPQNNEFSLVFVCTPSWNSFRNTSNTPMKTGVLTTYPTHDPTPAHINLMMRWGFFESLRNMMTALQELPQSELNNILAGGNVARTIRVNDLRVIQAYGELLQLITSNEKRLSLLKLPDSFIAPNNAAYDAYKHLLSL